MEGAGWILTAILIFFGIFALWLVIMTIVGAIILYIIVLVFNVGTFSWWYAFLVGILLSLIGSFFTSSRVVGGEIMKVIEKHYYHDYDYEEK